MFRPLRTSVWSAALAAAALLLAGQPAAAQGMAGYYYETYRYGYNPGYYARRVVVPGPYVTTTKTSPPGVAPGSYVRYAPAGEVTPSAHGSYLAAVGAGSAQAGAIARIELRVPDGAEVWFGGVRTEQSGTQRQFESPPLVPGKVYAYEIRVVWKADGREVAERRNVSVHAGDWLTESFPAAVGQ
jgi:uncharacterized protein (TIGR03000 family)